MPTHVRADGLTIDEALHVVSATTSAPLGDGTAVGLEVEWFPIVGGAPTRRLPLDAAPGTRSVRSLLSHLPSDGDNTWQLPSGSVVKVEPGAQLELVGSCSPSVGDALAETEAAAAEVAARFATHGIALASAGIDLWHDPGSIPQQLDSPRYPAMAAYFAARGPAGGLMMRHTCSIQLNLDLGSPHSVREERWLVANLLAPVATATFANSPGLPVRSRRSLAWQTLDPTRTGFPSPLVDGRGTLADQVLDAALRADVLLVPVDDASRGGERGAVPGRPGWRFGDWLQHGHPVHGWPTAADLRTHLSTLFHEVRARGPIEIRSVDALPARWRGVPLVLYAGAMFDPDARRRVRRVLERRRGDLPGLLSRSARLGVADPSLCAIAVEVWSFALAGARRHGIEAAHLLAAEAFLDRYTLRGRCPADELAERMADDPADALAWVTEPVPASTGSPR